MTLKDLLERIDIIDHSRRARFPDGSGESDIYMMSLTIDGHGEPLNAEIDKIRICKHGMFIDLNGESDKRYQAAQEGKER